MRCGFTILELLVVIGIIIALAGMSFPVFASIRNKSDISATTQLVHAVAAAIEGYTIKVVTGSDGKIYHAWVLNQDTSTTCLYFIDGDPRLYPTGSAMALRAPASYTGLVNMTGISMSGKQSLSEYGELLDRWRQPLHLVYAARTYGAGDFGVWSTGRDGRMSTRSAIVGTTADDICSWSNANGND
jgi:type II secretory pathway pseudopilin PulG